MGSLKGPTLSCGNLDADSCPSFSCWQLSAYRKHWCHFKSKQFEQEARVVEFMLKKLGVRQKMVKSDEIMLFVFWKRGVSFRLYS